MKEIFNVKENVTFVLFPRFIFALLSIQGVRREEKETKRAIKERQNSFHSS
jgi:hypothetical protein